MRRTLTLLSTALLTIGLIAACSGDPERPRHSPADLPPQPINNTIGAGGGEGGAPDGSTRDAGTDSSTPTSCNDLTLTSNEVPETGVSGDPPGGTGGALTDGTYDLIEAQKFVGAGTPGATGTTFKATLRITGQTIDRVIRQNTNADRRQRGTYATASPGLTYAIACPVAAQEQLTYSVNGNNITLTDVLARTSWTFVKK